MVWSTVVTQSSTHKPNLGRKKVTMKTITNASMFIIPNSLQSPKTDMWEKPMAELSERSECLNFKMRKDELAPWGINVKLNDTFVQVWIHADGSDNLTDHGLDDEMIDELWPNGEQAACYAPGYLPISLFEGKKEGDTVTLTTTAEVKLDVKLEQLPYRYGHFGTFEEVLGRLIRKDVADTERLNEWGAWLKKKGVAPDYSAGAFENAVKRIEAAGFEVKRSRYRDNDFDYVDVVINEHKTLRLARSNSDGATILQHNLVSMYFRGASEAAEIVASALAA